MFTALSENPICGVTEGLRRAAFHCYGCARHALLQHPLLRHDCQAVYSAVMMQFPSPSA